MVRVLNWLKYVLSVVLLLGVLAAVAYLLQRYTVLLDGVVPWVNREVAHINRSLTTEVVAGASLGAVILTAAILVFPLFLQGVRKGQYLASIHRGLLCSAVFFLTDRLYSWAEKISPFHLVVTVILVICASFVLIETVARAFSQKKESEIRTSLVASLGTGITFALLVRVAGSFLERVAH